MTLATGGTLSAAAEIVEGLGKTVEGVNVLIELSALNGAKKYNASTFSIVQC